MTTDEVLSHCEMLFMQIFHDLLKLFSTSRSAMLIFTEPADLQVMIGLLLADTI